MRLEVHVCHSDFVDLVWFQFQTGAIRSPSILCLLVLLRGFNSKLVRLEEVKEHTTHWDQEGFNSKLVRLEDEDKTGRIHFHVFGFNSKLVRLEVTSANLGNITELSEFQFQTGAIRSIFYAVDYPFIRVFQFQTGAIRRMRRKSKRKQTRDVSIPNWCD